MDGINYEDSQPDCYNDFEGAEMYLPVFGENSEAEKDLRFTVEEKSVAGQEVYGDYGFTVKEEEDLAKIKGFFARRELAKMKEKGKLDLEIKGRPTIDFTSGQEVYGDYGFTVKEEEDLAKIKGFFARRELAKMKEKGKLDLEIKGRPTIDFTSTVLQATKEDKGLDFIRVPDTQTHHSGQPSAKQVLAMASLDK